MMMGRESIRMGMMAKETGATSKLSWLSQAWLMGVVVENDHQGNGDGGR